MSNLCPPPFLFFTIPVEYVTPMPLRVIHSAIRKTNVTKLSPPVEPLNVSAYALYVSGNVAT